jgi:hypothetical protein
MARIRSVHPGLATDEDLVSVSIAARYFFVLLLTECDDQGIFEWKPTTLKMRLFPADNLDIGALLSELEGIDALRSYEIDGRKYGAVRNFRKFQRPKKPNSVHPMRDDFRTYVGLGAPNPEPEADEPEPVPHQFPTRGEKSPQMEDGGKDEEEDKGVEAAKRGSRLPDDFILPTEWRQEAAKKRAEHRLPSIDLNLEAEKFTNHWLAKSGADGRKRDWHRTWLNWSLNANVPRANGVRAPPPSRSLGPAMGTPEWHAMRRQAGAE